MGSLTSLNTFGNQTLTFTDNRPSGVIFSWPTARDIETELSYTLGFAVQKTIDIEDIVQPSTANVYYEIDVSAVTGATVTWSTVPAGMSVTTPSTGIYRISTINTVADWLTVSTPQINLPSDFLGSMQYTASIYYTTDSGTQNMSWTVGKTIPVANMQGIFTQNTTAKRYRGITKEMLGVFAMSAEANELIVDYLEAGSLSLFDYIPGNADAFGNAAPQLTNFSSDPVTYSVTMTMNENDILESFSYSGTPDVSFAYDSSTKTATFSGNRTDVNTALQTIVINIKDTTVAYYWPYDITVSITNSYNSMVDTFVVAADATDTTYLGPVTSDTYTTNTPTTIQGGPEVDPGATKTGRFTTIIRPRDETQVTSFTGEQVTERDFTFSQTINNDSLNNNNWAQHVLSENGDYLMIPGPEGAQVFYRGSNGTLSEQYEFSTYSGRYMSYIYENSVGRWYGTDMSSDGSYLAIGLADNAVMSSANNWYVQIKTRSGTTWSAQTEIGPFNSPIINAKLTPEGVKLLVLTEAGQVYVYNRSGSTWSQSYNFSGILQDTFSGTDNGTPYSYTLTYDLAWTRRIGFCTVGTDDRIMIGMNFDNIAGGYVDSTSPGYSAVVNHLDAKYKIYRVSGSTETLEATLFKKTQTAGVEATKIMSCDFNSDASKAVSLGRNNTAFASNTNYVSVTNRSGNNWSNAHTLGVGQFVVDVAQADSTTDKVIVTMEQDSTLQQRLRYFMAEGSSFVEQFTIAPSTAVNTGFGSIQPSLGISGDGNYISLINPVYNSNSRTNGRYYEYTVDGYGRVETGTKELTITANKTDTDNLIENWTMTPATDESGTIQIVYFVTDPDGNTTSRIQDVDNT